MALLKLAMLSMLIVNLKSDALLLTCFVCELSRALSDASLGDLVQDL